jgi:hypothetical protein
MYIFELLMQKLTLGNGNTKPALEPFWKFHQINAMSPNQS